MSDANAKKANQDSPTTTEEGENFQNDHRLGIFGMLLSAAGVAMMTITMLGSSAVAVIWSSGKLMGLPDWFLLPFYVAASIGVLWATVWATGRAWHVEKLLESGRDIDVPVFKPFYYWTKRALVLLIPPASLSEFVSWVESAMVAV